MFNKNGLILFGVLVILIAIFLIYDNVNLRFEDNAEENYGALSSVEEISLISVSGFVSPENSFREKTAIKFSSESVYTREYNRWENEDLSQNFSKMVPDAQKIADEIGDIVLKGDLLNYQQTTDCVVMDAGSNTFTFLYEGKSYSFDLIPLTLCDDNVDYSEQALLDLVNLLKKTRVKLEAENEK